MKNASNNVLIILYYWPPAGGPGVQRWLKFAKYLKDFQIEVSVFVPKNPHYPQIDKSLELEIPKHVEVIKSKISEPYSFSKLFSKKNTSSLSKGIIKAKKNQGMLQKLLLFIRGNFFIPDARKSWIKPSVKKISKLLASNKFDTIITTGPPHSLHRIGHALKQKFPQVKWIADFRDPWTTIGYHHQLKMLASTQRKHLKMETEVLQTADHIIVTSPSTLQEFSEKTDRPITLITNGYDSIDIEQVLDEHFSLSHVGTLMNERNPIILWKILSESIEEDKSLETHLEIKFAGNIGEEVKMSLAENGLLKHCTFLGYLSHNEAQSMMFNSQMLLLIEKDIKETKSIIPGKLFEYLHSRRPIVAIGPKNWDVKGILNEQKAGKCFDYSDEIALKEHIKLSFSLYLNGKLNNNSIKPEQYHRKKLTESLSKIIKDM